VGPTIQVAMQLRATPRSRRRGILELSAEYRKQMLDSGDEFRYTICASSTYLKVQQFGETVARDGWR
jgi:hypothetical protein